MILFILSFGTTAGAQEEDKKSEKGELYLSGKVVNEKKRGLESIIYIYKKGDLINEFSTSKIGKFSFEVPMQDSIAFVVYSEGYVSKTVLVTTQIHPAKENKNFSFPFFIDLYPIGRTPAHIDLERPVGKIIHQSGQFIYDVDFTKESNKKLKEFIRERKDLKVRDAKD